MPIAAPTYIRLSRHNVYYFRWPLPAYIHPQSKISHVEASLGTRKPKEALRLARGLEYYANRFNDILVSNIMSYADAQKVLKRIFTLALAEQKSRIDAEGALPHSEMLSLQSAVSSIQQIISEGDYAGAGNGIIEDATAHRIIETVRKELPEIDLQEGSPSFDKLKHDAKLAYLAYSKELLDYNSRLNDYDFSQPVITQQVRKASKPLKDLIDDFVAERKRGNQWTEATEKDRKPQFALLCEILGENTSITAIEPQEAAEVKKILQLLPKNRNKNAKTRNLPLDKAIRVEGVDKLNVKTVNEYLTAYQSLFGWAEDNGLITRSPFKNLNIRQKKNKQDNRLGFTPAQIKTILKALEDHTPEKSGTSYRYWGVMLAIYTGARLNEIAQLGLDDIRQEDGIWYFDINDEDENEKTDGKKRLKNDSSKRRVPIHDALLNAGILERIEKLRQAKQTRLFPDLKYLKGHKYGRNLARWANDKFLVKHGMKDKKLSFHSFRHTFATSLLNAGVQEGIVQELLGHAKQTVTQAVYNKGYDLTILKEALRKLR